MRKSSGGLGMSGVGAKADSNFGRLHVCFYPAAGGVPEVDASFQKLAHGECRECHDLSFFRFIRRGRCIQDSDTGTAARDVSPEGRKPACVI